MTEAPFAKDDGAPEAGKPRCIPEQLSRDELVAALEETRRHVQQLRCVEAEHQKAREHLELAAHALRERVKEINCMYSISEFSAREGSSIDEVIQLIVDAIPPAWQYPDVTCSRVTIDGKTYRTANFAPAGDRLAQPIYVDGSPVGLVEVFYLEARPPSYEGAFLKEERSLINGIASRIGEIVEKRRTEAAVAASHAKNRALLAAIPDLIVQIDKDGTLLDYHVGDYTFLSDLLGRMRGENFGELFGDRGSDSAFCGLVSGGEARVFERRVTIEGRAHDFEVRLVRASESISVGILRDITQKKRLEREILEVSGREQRRIGRDLHDGLCQHLVGIGFLTQALARSMPNLDDSRTRDVREIARLIDEAISLAKGLTRGLLPVRLESDGLGSGLAELAAHAERIFGVSCQAHCCDTHLLVDANAALHVYRIAQEALNNAIKHGHASRIEILLSQESRQMTLLIIDDGIGFDDGDDGGCGMGLGIMRYRAQMIRGTLSVSSAPDQGTTVTCRFPLSPG